MFAKKSSDNLFRNEIYPADVSQIDTDNRTSKSKLRSECARSCVSTSLLIFHLRMHPGETEHWYDLLKH